MLPWTPLQNKGISVSPQTAAFILKSLIWNPSAYDGPRCNNLRCVYSCLAAPSYRGCLLFAFINVAENVRMILHQIHFHFQARAAGKQTPKWKKNTKKLSIGLLLQRLSDPAGWSLSQPTLRWLCCVAAGGETGRSKVTAGVTHRSCAVWLRPLWLCSYKRLGG